MNENNFNLLCFVKLSLILSREMANFNLFLILITINSKLNYFG